MVFRRSFPAFLTLGRHLPVERVNVTLAFIARSVYLEPSLHRFEDVFVDTSNLHPKYRTREYPGSVECDVGK